VVFWYSLKDVRSTAPHMSRGSRAGQNWPTALNILIRATQPDIAFRCCWAYLPVRKPAAEEIQPISRHPYIPVRQHGMQSRFSAQEM